MVKLITNKSKNLEKKIKEGKLNRRDFLKLTGKGAGLTTLFFLLNTQGCKSPNSPNVPNGPTTPTTVKVKANIYNHTQGYIGEKTYTGTSGALLPLKANEITSTNTDPDRITARYATTEGNLGTIIGASQIGTVNWSYPNQDTTIEIFLMNSSNNAPYEEMDKYTNVGLGKLIYNPNVKWRREDQGSYTGPAEPANNAIMQMHNALQFPWARYGSITKPLNTRDANFGVGYGNCNGLQRYNTGSWAGVNPNLVNDNIQRQRMFIEGIFELITGAGDFFGTPMGSHVSNASGTLNAVGRDLFTYVHVNFSTTGF